MDITSLLNPATGLDQSPSTSTVPTSLSPEPMFSAASSDIFSSSAPSKRQRSESTASARLQLQQTSLLTDIRSDQCKYQPYEGEPRDGELASQMKSKHRDFKIKTGGHIAKSTKHIPYTSDKRTLNAKTGLGALNGQYFLKLDRSKYYKAKLIPKQHSTTRSSTVAGPGMSCGILRSALFV